MDPERSYLLYPEDKKVCCGHCYRLRFVVYNDESKCAWCLAIGGHPQIMFQTCRTFYNFG